MTTSAAEVEPIADGDGQPIVVSTNSKPTKIGLLTGGFDRPYAFGLVMALAMIGIHIDVMGGAEVDGPEMHTTEGVSFVDAYGNPRKDIGRLGRATRVIRCYYRLVRYASFGKVRILHLLWNYKFAYFDRTILTLYYKLLGKKVVFTAHNVNAGKRDGNDSFLNRLTLKIQYRLTDHIFVHTERMKRELIEEFGISESKTTVIPFGINNSVPDSPMTGDEARQRLGIGSEERVVLFYGAIRPYKGLEHLVAAVQRVNRGEHPCRLVIAGEPKADGKQYFQEIEERISNDAALTNTIRRIEFVPDAETEVYFKAADVSVLPYTEVFQSGVLFLSYSFGLPVIASDVGSFAEDVIEGETGFICKTQDSHDLAQSIERYFQSELYHHLRSNRQSIREYANRKHSWRTVGLLTQTVYSRLVPMERPAR